MISLTDYNPDFSGARDPHRKRNSSAAVKYLCCPTIITLSYPSLETNLFTNSPANACVLQPRSKGLESHPSKSCLLCHQEYKNSRFSEIVFSIKKINKKITLTENLPFFQELSKYLIHVLNRMRKPILSVHFTNK